MFTINMHDGMRPCVPGGVFPDADRPVSFDPQNRPAPVCSFVGGRAFLLVLRKNAGLAVKAGPFDSLVSRAPTSMCGLLRFAEPAAILLYQSATAHPSLREASQPSGLSRRKPGTERRRLRRSLIAHNQRTLILVFILG